MTTEREKDCCHTDISINNHGTLNIYACSSPAHDAPPHPEECAPLPVSFGACVPLGLGVKPKQSQRQKLDRLLAGNRIPSAFGAAFVHMSRRFVSGRQPGNPLEETVFDRLRALPPDLRSILTCALDQFDLGTVLTPQAEIISVIPSSAARFEIISEQLFAHRETSPAFLGSDEFPPPSPTQYVLSSDIKVKVHSVTKGGSEYLESRDYTCDDEDSRYEITLRYRRTA